MPELTIEEQMQVLEDRKNRVLDELAAIERELVAPRRTEIERIAEQQQALMRRLAEANRA